MTVSTGECFQKDVYTTKDYYMEFSNPVFKWVLLGIPPRYFLIQLSISIATCSLMLLQDNRMTYGLLSWMIASGLLYPYAIYFYHSKTNNHQSILIKVFALWLCLSFAFILGPISIINQLLKVKRSTNAREF